MNPTADSVHDAVSKRLSDAGQRYTEGRRQLVDALSTADQPLTMPQILERVPGMPLSSAYRHLTVLASYNVVHRISVGSDENGSFELTDDVSGHHHHHVVCEQCGTIVDVSSSPRLEKALIAAADAAAEESGFAIDAHRIELIGRCANCR